MTPERDDLKHALNGQHTTADATVDCTAITLRTTNNTQQTGHIGVNSVRLLVF